MRVVILGGSGFIGSALACLLANRGDTVSIPSRTPEISLKKQHCREMHRAGEIVHVAWDGKNPSQLAVLLHGAHAVVNLLGENIAEARWTVARKQRIVSSRLRVGSALSEVLTSMQTRPAVLVQASAVGWYGSWPDMELAPLCTEQSPPGSNFLADTAERWENSTAQVDALPDMRRCIIRTAPVLGPGGGMLARLLPIFRYGLGGQVGSGVQPFCWIHLEDQIAAIAFLLDQPECVGPYNLVSPETVNAREFAKTLGEVMGRPTWFSVPAFALRLLYGEMANEMLLTGQRVFPERLLKAGFQFRFPELGAALLHSV